jgi:polyhydroxyalkanoate synthesis regulator phasin
MSEEQRGRTGIGEGLRAGIGILTAFKEAIEETIDEAAAKNDLRPERAKEALTGALTRAQGAFDDVRERLDVVPRREFDALRLELEELRRRVERLEGGPPRLLDAGGPGAGG